MSSLILLLSLSLNLYAANNPDAAAYLNYVKNYLQWSEGQMLKQQREFVETFPTSIYADNVMFVTAQSFFYKRKFQLAGRIWQKQLKKYPNADKSVAARFGLGLTLIEMGRKKSGLDLLQKILERYPNTQEARRAKVILASH